MIFRIALVKENFVYTTHIFSLFENALFVVGLFHYLILFFGLSGIEASEAICFVVAEGCECWSCPSSVCRFAFC